jgi:transcriptional regulator with XRE-family HTH domain
MGPTMSGAMPRRMPLTGDPLIDRLAAERIERGWTLQEVAERMGRMTYQAVWAWESGTNSPTLVSLRRWAAVFDLDVGLVRR